MNKFILAGVAGCFLLVGPIVCLSATWDKNDIKDKSVESSYYDKDSIKVQGKTISLTEKFILTSAGEKIATQVLSKYQACKHGIDKKGDVAQYQRDYQIEDGKYRIMAIRYYNKADEMLCTDKDVGKDVYKSWVKIDRRSQMETVNYDLVTKYKVVVPN